jgi:hypothetical protein
MVARGWPHEGQLTLSESAARATRFSNSRRIDRSGIRKSAC